MAPFLVSFDKNGDVPYPFVCLPEGNGCSSMVFSKCGKRSHGQRALKLYHLWYLTTIQL